MWLLNFSSRPRSRKQLTLIKINRRTIFDGVMTYNRGRMSRIFSPGKIGKSGRLVFKYKIYTKSFEKFSNYRSQKLLNYIIINVINFETIKR